MLQAVAEAQPSVVIHLAAQVAANAKGVEELRRMTRDFGRHVVEAYMGSADPEFSSIH